ncbi:MAG: hypothetical protein M1818_006124 [Claussenomyces sp. TS43310]|nr:MAG: hypothetical protein M1818_006124 [Claussenomyces sp. TS43310]
MHDSDQIKNPGGSRRLRRMERFTDLASRTASDAEDERWPSEAKALTSEQMMQSLDLTTSMKHNHRQTSMIDSVMVSAAAANSAKTSIRSEGRVRSRTWGRKNARSSPSFLRRLRVSMRNGLILVSRPFQSSHSWSSAQKCWNRTSRQLIRPADQHSSARKASGPVQSQTGQVPLEPPRPIAHSGELCAALSGNPLMSDFLKDVPMVQVFDPEMHLLSPTRAAERRPLSAHRSPRDRQLLHPMSAQPRRGSRRRSRSKPPVPGKDHDLRSSTGETKIKTNGTFTKSASVYVVRTEGEALRKRVDGEHHHRTLTSAIIVRAANREANLHRELRRMQEALVVAQVEAAAQRRRADDLRELYETLLATHQGVNGKLHGDLVQQLHDVVELPPGQHVFAPHITPLELAAPKEIHELAAQASDRSLGTNAVPIEGIGKAPAPAESPIPSRLSEKGNTTEDSSQVLLARHVETCQREEATAPRAVVTPTVLKLSPSLTLLRPFIITTLSQSTLDEKETDPVRSETCISPAAETKSEVEGKPPDEKDDGSDDVEEDLPRMLFRFGSRRVQAVPAVHRCRIPTADLKEEGPVEARLLPQLDTWEWCSVPDLPLGVSRLT